MQVRAWHNVPKAEQRLRFWTEPEVEVDLAAQAGVEAFRMGVDWGRIVLREPQGGKMEVRGVEVRGWMELDQAAVARYKEIVALCLPFPLVFNSTPQQIVQAGVARYKNIMALIDHTAAARYKKIDHAAVARYKEIMALVRARGMRVMLTLFHHSLPSWAEPIGGWTNASLINHFDSWTLLAVREFGPLVDYWVTFNEPHLFVILTYCMGVWPPGKAPSLLQSALCMSPVGQYSQAMQHIGEAHIAAFKTIKKGSTAPVGVAANTAFMTPYSALDVVVPLYIDWMTLFPWVDHIQHHLDFCGLNYYGQEFMSTAGLQSVEEEEFSEAGRAVYPDGFYRILMAFHRRYSPHHPKLRFIVTENGFADTEDNIRRPYLIEHLLALNAAIKEGMPIDAYFHWTISDNWEWADGYCPKFGLAGVDRASPNLTRVLRPSYGLFKEIVESRRVTVQQREEEWGQLQQRAQRGEQRSYCRAVEPSGRMGAGERGGGACMLVFGCMVGRVVRWMVAWWHVLWDGGMVASVVACMLVNGQEPCGSMAAGERCGGGAACLISPLPHLSSTTLSLPLDFWVNSLDSITTRVIATKDGEYRRPKAVSVDQRFILFLSPAHLLPSASLPPPPAPPDSLDSPTTRVVATKDWRYGEYRRPKAAVMVKRTARIFRIWLEDLLLAAQQAADAANSLLCRLMHGPHHQQHQHHQHQQQQQHQHQKNQQQQQQQQAVEQQHAWEEVEADIEIPPVVAAAAAAAAGAGVGAASADKDEL
ncbi:unnamed protein product [Closterium sp. NIES-65]|nr:unnamed protein product [Closterium sp. NIES-65]